MRTESQMITKAPEEVTFGEAKYELKPLSILKAREWRSLLNSEMVEITGSLSASQSDTSIGPALTSALINFPEKMAGLVFAWSPDLDKEKVLAEATEEQLAVAFSTIMRFAYPFLASLQTVLQVVKSM